MHNCNLTDNYYLSMLIKLTIWLKVKKITSKCLMFTFKKLTLIFGMANLNKEVRARAVAATADRVEE